MLKVPDSRESAEIDAESDWENPLCTQFPRVMNNPILRVSVGTTPEFQSNPTDSRAPTYQFNRYLISLM